jgi:flavin reductase (DIM6/NTAB) family NADH-FMN oxidoreductase RutF
VSVTAEEFKAALRGWTSGVAIVTSRAGDEIHGMTVSAFSSVSMLPPLVLICADKSSNTNPLIVRGQVFAVNVLAADQQALSIRFASKHEEWRRFEGIDWSELATGAPILAGVASALDCRVVATHDAGDHLIHVGSVEAATSGGGEPLLYFDAAYRTLAPKS